VLARSRQNMRAALKRMRKLLKKQGYIPEDIITDQLGSYSAALRDLGLAPPHVAGNRLNNRTEGSHPLPGSGLFAKLWEGANAVTRTPNGSVQVTRINTAISVCSRRHLHPFAMCNTI
jgi:hypothetical protein